MPNKLLRVGVPTYWGNLTPALQHTAYADALLSNQFESLVREGRGGTILPNLATEWSFNDDSTVFRFKLDGQRKFSDGHRLTAQDVKNAWELGLTLQPRSANSSLRDVFYLVEGFDRFEADKKLSGVRVLDSSTGEVRFVKPFRTALSEFSTGRMAIFRLVGDAPVGTGPFVIKSSNDNRLDMTKNPYYTGPLGFSNVEVKIVDPKSAGKALASGEVDVYAFADRADIGDCSQSGINVSCVTGMESGHLTVSLNGLKGRVLENAQLRLAVQYLIHSSVNKDILPVNYRNNLDIDPQPYLPLQAGRLDRAEVDKIVASGQAYVPALIAASEARPFYLVTSEMNNWVQKILEQADVKFAANSGWIDTKVRMGMFYKTHEPDIIVGGSSIASGDPDGLFHSLSRDGAIHSPMIFRKKVSDLLESGRSILDQSMLDAHYKQVSLAFLQSVPYVHVGFVRGMHAYNPKKVQIVNSVREREGNQFTLFNPL